MLGEEAKRGCVGGLECGRGQPVDDDEDDRLRLRLGGVSRGQAIGPGVALRRTGARRAPNAGTRLPRGTRAQGRSGATPTSEARVSNRAVPPRVPPRRSVPRTRGADPRAPQIAAGCAAGSLVPLAEQESDRDGRRRCDDEPGSARRTGSGGPTPIEAPRPTRMPIVYQSPTPRGYTWPATGHDRPVSDDPRPQLVFFTSARSGPARRMESLVAHLARKEPIGCA